MAVDLSVEIKTARGPIRLKNPLLPGSSEIAVEDISVKRCIDNGVGGVLTKSVGNETTDRLWRSASRPWAYPLCRFGPEFKYSWLHDGLFFQPEKTPKETAEKRLPKWKKWCQDAGIPLIVSVCDTAVENWPKLAKMVEDAGADAIELDASCPMGKVALSRGKETIMFSEDMWADTKYATKIIESVRNVTKVPIGAKMSPWHNPVALHASNWENAGLNFLVGQNAIPGIGIWIDTEAEEVFGPPGLHCLHDGRHGVALSLYRLASVLQVVKIPVIGVGGIVTPDDVIRYLLLGCSAVEVCSGVYFKGHKLFKELAEGLTDWMQRHGYTHIDQFRGKLQEDASCTKADWEGKYGYVMAPVERAQLLADLEPSPVVPRVNMEKCTLCDVCDDVCIYGTIKVDHENKKLDINEDTCIGCGMCMGICPENPGALWLEDKRTGEMVWDGVGMVKSFKKKATGGYSPYYTPEELDQVLREREARKK